MRLPDFLIVGAMKSGTTGVFMDLCQHPQVFVPQDKEPHALSDDRVLTESGRSEYAAGYARAHDDQRLCDASTVYTKLPDWQGAAERALAVLPNDFRVIYVVRDSIDRIVSHHYHEFIEGTIGSDIGRAVREEPRFVDYSRYGYQLAPWIKAVGRERVRVVQFESYKADRQGTITQLCDFLGLPVEQMPQVDGTVYNRSEEKTVTNWFWRLIQKSSLYQRGVRQLISPRWRIRLQKWVLPRGPGRPAPPSSETIGWLRSQLTEDVMTISEYAGSAIPLWDGYEPTRAVEEAP